MRGDAKEPALPWALLSCYSRGLELHLITLCRKNLPDPGANKKGIMEEVR